MTRQELLNELKILLDDTVGAKTSDLLVKDTMKYSLMSEGQDKFCEETGLIVDYETVTTVAGTPSYNLSDKVIKVLNVFDGSRTIHSVDEDPAYKHEFYYPSSGKPYVWRTDLHPGQITFYPTPSEVLTLSLQVWRYPNESLVTADPEIPERFQKACIHWAAFKILQVNDVEVINKSKASEQFEMFQMYVNDGIKHLRRRNGVNRKTGCNTNYLLGLN